MIANDFKPGTRSYTLSQGDKSLYVFGVSHCADPHSPLLREAEEFFGSTNAALVLVEGAEDLHVTAATHRRLQFLEKFSRLSRDEIIRRNGEGGLGVLLGVSNDLPVFCPEPPLAMLFSSLNRIFSREDLFTEFMLQCLLQCVRDELDEPNRYLKVAAEQFEDQMPSSWDGFCPSVDLFWRTLSDHTPHVSMFELDVLKMRRTLSPFTSTISPFYCRLTEVSRVASDYRDCHIVKELISFVELARSVFIIYGRSHAEKWEGRLREYFSRPETDQK